MNLDLTRRTLLHLAGASSLAAAAAQAARAEGNGNGGGPTFASRTPMRIGTVTMRVRQARHRRGLLPRHARPHRDGTDRHGSRTRLRRGEAPDARGASASRGQIPQGGRPLSHRVPDADAQGSGALAGPCGASIACRCRALPITASANPSISTIPKATASRSMPIAIPRSGNGTTGR